MTRETTLRTETLDLGNGKVLHVSRFEDPSGRDRLTLVRGFEESSPIPQAPEDVMELPGRISEELCDALEALDREGD